MNTAPRIQPKRDFMADTKRASVHQDVMASPHFKEAAKAALLQMQYRTVNLDPQSLAAATLMLKGAQDFLNILMSLGEPEKPQRTTITEDLVAPEVLLDPKRKPSKP